MVCVLRRLAAGRRRIRVGSLGRQAVLPSDASIERTVGSRTPGAGSHSLPRDRALRPAGTRAAVSAARAESRFRINLFPGAVAFVLDPYVGGRGILEPTLLGLVSLGRDRSSDALDRAEMMRYLAEAAWYPTALLPSQGVTWFAIDESSANATIHDGHHAVSMLFRFDEFGMSESVSSEERAATEGNRMVMRPRPANSLLARCDRIRAVSVLRRSGCRGHVADAKWTFAACTARGRTDRLIRAGQACLITGRLPMKLIQDEGTYRRLIQKFLAGRSTAGAFISRLSHFWKSDGASFGGNSVVDADADRHPAMRN